MALHLVPVEEPHEFALGCPCRPVAGIRLSRGRMVPVVEHRSMPERWRGAQATARPAPEPVEEDEADA